MHQLSKPLGLLMLLSIAGCDGIINEGAALVLKNTLIEKCGKEDPACIIAVETQFDSCHDAYQSQWDAYMAANTSDEDKPLKEYSMGVYSCIVDVDGYPYFNYTP